MALDWNEKHRPRNLDDVVGNRKAVEELRAWAAAWREGVPEKRAVVLSGPPGTGKTSAALALAREMGWGVVEMNASDQRNAEIVSRVAGAGARNETFTAEGEFKASTSGGRKLILLDEADNLAGREDRGGIQAIVQTIRGAGQPIALIANDYYELTRRGSALRSLALQVKFTRVNRRLIPNVLARVAKAEGVEVSREVLEAVAERSGGDLRAAVNDLQALALGVKAVKADVVASLGDRDGRATLFDAVSRVLKVRDYRAAREAVHDLDETPEGVLLWIDENLPREYAERADLARGFDALARADVYLGRVRRRQYYGLWSYASDLMTAGVALAKDRPYHGYTPVQFPTYLRRMGASKGMRETRDSLARKLGGLLHLSMRSTRTDVVPALRVVAKRHRSFARALVRDAGLTEAEAGSLLEADADDAAVQALFEEEPQDTVKPDRGAGGKTPAAPPQAPPPPPEETPREGQEPRKKQRNLMDF